MLALFCKWLFWVVGAALLGFLLAWLMRGSKAGEWQSQFEERDASYKKLKGSHQGFVSKYENLERSSNKLRASHNTLKKDLSSYETKNNKLMSQLKAVPAAAVATAVVSNGSSDNSYEIRAWESKYARLERELATKSDMFDELQENNDTLNTKMEVLALTTEDAKKEKISALSKLKQYEEYRPRFEEANLERNTLKHKYQQLVAARSAIQTTTQETSNQTDELTSEIDSLKTKIAVANEQTTAQKAQIEALTSQNTAAINDQKEIKIKYDSLLGLQERTEVKMKELEQKATTPVAVAPDNSKEIETYKSQVQVLTKDNETLKGSLEAAKSEISKAKANDSTAEIANWADKHKALSEENNRLKTSLEQSKLEAAKNAAPKVNEFEQKWNALKKEETNWTSKHNALNEDNKQLKAALEQSKLEAAKNAAPKVNEFEQKWNALKKEEAVWTSKHNELSEENEDLKDALEEQLTIARKAAPISNEYEQKWNALKNEQTVWSSKHNTLNEENKQLKTALEQSKLAAAQNAAPTVNEFEQKWNALKKEETSWSSKHNTLTEENRQLKSALEQSKAATTQRTVTSIATPAPAFDGFEQKWNALKKEEGNWATQKQTLEAEIEKLKAAKKPAAKGASKAEKAAKAEAAKGLLASAIGTKIKVATEAEKDDLKLISGVGPFLETKLNTLGIYTFEQVGQFDTDLMQIVNDAIEFFPGRVQRDDWVGQAKQLNADKKS